MQRNTVLKMGMKICPKFSPYHISPNLKKMSRVSARKLSIHKTYSIFSEKFDTGKWFEGEKSAEKCSQSDKTHIFD
jgi:hypothetical protein